MVFGVGLCGGCGFFFFFLGCDRCLKGLWVVVRSDVWDVVGLWLRWVMAEVGRWSWIGKLGLDWWAGIC